MANSAVEEKRRILIVDDDRDGTHLIKVLLEKIGPYLALEENDAAKAHQSARNFRPDLILLDIMMPQRDGGDIAAQIDADPGFHRTPIVFSPRWSRKPMQKPGHREHLYAMDVGRGITQILLSNVCRYAKKNADLRPFEVNRSCAFRSLPDNCWKCSEIIADNLSKAGLELGLRLSH